MAFVAGNIITENQSPETQFVYFIHAIIGTDFVVDIYLNKNLNSRFIRVPMSIFNDTDYKLANVKPFFEVIEYDTTNNRAILRTDIYHSYAQAVLNKRLDTILIPRLIFLNDDGCEVVGINPVVSYPPASLPTIPGPDNGRAIQTANAKVTTDQTTTSSSLVDLTGASVTITTQANSRILVIASYSMSNSSALGSSNRVVVAIDNTVEPKASSTFNTPLISNHTQGGGIVFEKTDLAAGSHTFKMQWSNSAGTTQCRPNAGAPNTEHASIMVMEIGV
jgi:hypothetical protein